MRFLQTFLLCLLLCPNCFAQFGMTTLHVTTEGKKQTLKGTCCLIASDIVITCHHAVYHRGSTGQVTVTMGGQQYTTKTIISDPFDDVALLRLDRPVKGQSPVTVSSLGCGEPIMIGGFAGEEDNWRYMKGHILLRELTEDFSCQSVTLRAIPRPGDSGGPVLDMDGNLIGIVVGFTGDQDEEGNLKGEPLYGLVFEISQFLNRALPDNPNWSDLKYTRPYMPVLKDMQWQLREQELTQYLRELEIPVPSRHKQWIN